jgi:hypothetical protein
MRTVWVVFGVVCVGVALSIASVAAFMSWNVAMGTLPLSLKFLVIALGIAITYFLFATVQSFRANYRVQFLEGSTADVALWRRRALRAWLVGAMIMVTILIAVVIGEFQ